MPLNKVNPKGNMYQFLNDYPEQGSNKGYTWNAVKGKCFHDCHYCYCKKWGEQPELHFDEKELRTDLDKGNFIFVGSSCDMFAQEISLKWIMDILCHCNKFDNKYLFQSKNPESICYCRHSLPENSVVATTIETNRIYKEMGKAPGPSERVLWMLKLQAFGFKTCLTIEPIMNFDIDDLVKLIDYCMPSFVNIGGNTNYKVKLPEPEPRKVMALIEKLKDITEVKIKPNLKRLMLKGG